MMSRRSPRTEGERAMDEFGEAWFELTQKIMVPMLRWLTRLLIRIGGNK